MSQVQGAKRTRPFPGRVWFVLFLIPLLLLGCGKKPRTMQSAFQIADPGEIQRAIDHGKRFRGRNPYEVYNNRRLLKPNLRVSQNVIIRSAAVCMPADEVAFTVASLPRELDDQALAQKVDKAVDDINRQVKFVVTLQLAQGVDPNSIGFEMLTNTSTSPYPTVVPPKPRLLQEVPASPEGDVAACSLYGYDVYFETIGSPGYPALDFSVTALDLVVKDGNEQASVHFASITGQ